MAVLDKFNNQCATCMAHMKQAQQEIIMDTNSNVNPAQCDSSRAEIYVDMESVGYQREPPPPYSVQNVQPQTIIKETIIMQPPLKDRPMYFPCPKCYKRVLTKVEHVNTKKTHMLAGFIFGLTCWCLLCCLAYIPYLLPTFKKVDHYCPECNTFLGDYSRV